MNPRAGGGISLPELSNYSREISVDIKTLKFNELSGFKVSWSWLTVERPVYVDAEWNSFRSDTPADNLSELTSYVAWWPIKIVKLDTELQSNLSLRTPLYYGQFVWSQKCQKSYIPYLYNTDTSVKRTLCSVPLVSVERSLTVLSSCWSIYLNGAVFLFLGLQFKATKSLAQSNGVFSLIFRLFLFI